MGNRLHHRRGLNTKSNVYDWNNNGPVKGLEAKNEGLRRLEQYAISGSIVLSGMANSLRLSRTGAVGVTTLTILKESGVTLVSANVNPSDAQQHQCIANNIAAAESKRKVTARKEKTSTVTVQEKDLNEHDVVYGDSSYSHSSGNSKCRVLLRKVVPDYVRATTSARKRRAVEDVVSTIRNNGGRHLLRNSEGSFDEISDDDAIFLKMQMRLRNFQEFQAERKKLGIRSGQR